MILSEKTALEQNARIRKEYENLVLAGKYGEAEELERKRGDLSIVLNEVISNLIIDSENGRREQLVSAFSHRGYGRSWLETRSYDQDL